MDNHPVIKATIEYIEKHLSDTKRYTQAEVLNGKSHIAQKMLKMCYLYCFRDDLHKIDVKTFRKDLGISRPLFDYHINKVIATGVIKRDQESYRHDIIIFIPEKFMHLIYGDYGDKEHDA